MPSAIGEGIFVGRARELALLEAAAAAARRGQPKVVLIEGEAGIGKSSLLGRFTQELDDARVLRASGDEAESLLPYGVVGQLVASVQGMATGPPGLLASDLTDDVDPLAVGAQLVTWLTQVRRGQEMALVLIDDLHWADRPSARALLFAVRRLQADPVLVTVTARPGELAPIGEGWQRFLAGDYRASQIRLAGLEAQDVVALGRSLGVGDLPLTAVGRLISRTSGNPLYCRAVLEDFGVEGLGRPGGALQVPRSLAEVVLTRVGALKPAAQELVMAAAVLGHSCELAAAAALADLNDPFPSLEEAVTAGIVSEQPGAPIRIGFVHLLMQQAIYESASPSRRRLMHERAAALVDQHQALRHRVAAAIGPDDGLADQLEAASRDVRRQGQIVQAATWLAQSASVSSQPEMADRRLLDALEIQVFDGELTEAGVLAAQMTTAGPTARRSMLLGVLDFLDGRPAAAEALLIEAWHDHNRALEGSVGAAAALQLAVLCLADGRIQEGIEWGERAAAETAVPAAVQHRAQGLLAIALFADGRGPEGLARLAFLPAAPSDVPREDTGALVLRGMARVLAEDLAGAIADLSTAAARLRAGIRLPTASGCLRYLAAAEWRLGSWDDAMVHAELALSLAQDTDRASELPSAHAFAAVVPAFRGEWEAASGHVRRAAQAAQATGLPGAIIAAAIAQATLAMAQGDLEGVVSAAAAVRATGRPEAHNLGRHDWRPLEIDALIGLGRLAQAEIALAELETGLSPVGPPSAMVTAARLRGDLATAAGYHAAAAGAFETAWRRAQDLRVPLTRAQLEFSDGRRLRAAGQLRMAVARLRAARQRLITLGARPYLQACDRELTAAGAPVGAEPTPTPVLPGLTPAEQAVARLVAVGRSNRQTAAELFVSVKTVEFHLRHIFDKLGIRSRKDLVTRIGAPSPPWEDSAPPAHDAP